MKIKDLEGCLLSIVTAYNRMRRTGHTKAAALVAKEMRGIVVCHSENSARQIARIYGVETTTLEGLAQATLGKNLPIIFDNETLYELFKDLAVQFEKQRERIAELTPKRTVLDEFGYDAGRDPTKKYVECWNCERHIECVPGVVRDFCPYCHAEWVPDDEEYENDDESDD